MRTYEAPLNGKGGCQPPSPYQGRGQGDGGGGGCGGGGRRGRPRLRRRHPGGVRGEAGHIVALLGASAETPLTAEWHRAGAMTVAADGGGGGARRAEGRRGGVRLHIATAGTAPLPPPTPPRDGSGQRRGRRRNHSRGGGVGFEGGGRARRRGRGLRAHDRRVRRVWVLASAGTDAAARRRRLCCRAVAITCRGRPRQRCGRGARRASPSRGCRRTALPPSSG